MSTDTMLPLGKYMLLEPLAPEHSYDRWRVHMKEPQVAIGHVLWCYPRDEYSFFTYVNIAFNAEMHETLAGFLRQVNGKCHAKEVSP